VGLCGPGKNLIDLGVGAIDDERTHAGASCNVAHTLKGLHGGAAFSLLHGQEACLVL